MELDKSNYKLGKVLWKASTSLRILITFLVHSNDYNLYLQYVYCRKLEFKAVC